MGQSMCYVWVFVCLVSLLSIKPQGFHQGVLSKSLSMPSHFQRAHLFTPFSGHSASYHCWHVACAVATILTPTAVHSLVGHVTVARSHFIASGFWGWRGGKLDATLTLVPPHGLQCAGLFVACGNDHCWLLPQIL